MYFKVLIGKDSYIILADISSSIFMYTQDQTTSREESVATVQSPPEKSVAVVQSPLQKPQVS